jgi:hypothetical protein
LHGERSSTHLCHLRRSLTASSAKRLLTSCTCLQNGARALDCRGPARARG